MTLQLEWIDERENGAGPREEQWVALLEKLLHAAGEKEGLDEGIVTLTFTDDNGIRELNRQYRGLDKPTDVLSFALRDTLGDEPLVRYEDEYETVDDGENSHETEAPRQAEDGDVDEADEEAFDPFEQLLGDIVISVPRAEAQAAEYGHSFERELGFLFVHGFLHLIGYDHGHEEQEREMFEKQDEILAEIGLLR